MTRLARLSARSYGRLSAVQRRAVDLLEIGDLGAAGRGEAKTVLGWRRTREETIAYARCLLDVGLMAAAVADRLGVSGDYLRRVLDPENVPRKPFIDAAETGLTDSVKVVGHPARSEAPSATPAYGGDPFAYDLRAALRGCR